MCGMAEAKFHGVDIGWMQAQWRDCVNKRMQLKIFRDMTGAKNPEILTALGEDQKAEFLPMKHAGTWSAEEDRFLLRAVSEGKSDREIAAEIGRGVNAVSVRLNGMRRRGIEVPQRWDAKKKAAERAFSGEASPFGRTSGADQRPTSGEVCPSDDPGGIPGEACQRFADGELQTTEDAVYPDLPEVDGALTMEERVCEPVRESSEEGECAGVDLRSTSIEFGIAGFAVFKKSIGELTEERDRLIEQLCEVEMKLSEAKAGMRELMEAIGSTPFDEEAAGE